MAQGWLNEFEVDERIPFVPIYNYSNTITLNNYKNTTENLTLRYTKKDDSWEVTSNITGYKVNGSTISYVKAGYHPCFNLIKYNDNDFSLRGDNRTWSITRTDEKLIIHNDAYGNLEKSKEYFSDGEVPHRLLVVLQGGGGNGQAASAYPGQGDVYYGGGSGAFACFIINLDLGTHYLFAGGQGRESSWTCQYNSNNYYISAGAGWSGSDSIRHGAGGIVSTNLPSDPVLVWNIQTQNGVAGQGYSMSSKTVYGTSSNTYRSYPTRYLYLSGGNGNGFVIGKNNTISYGGGASLFGSSGAPGKHDGQGHGSGGGAAIISTQSTLTPPGNGAAGVINIYY